MAYARALSTTQEFQSTLAAAKAGSEWAWAVIYRDLAGVLTGYLRTRGAPDPDDLCSETFLHVARGIGEFEGDYDSFRSWVFVIAHRRMVDARRAASRRPSIVPDDGQIESIPVSIEVDEQAISLLATEELHIVLDSLTDDQRDVLALRLIADLSVRQTAEVMGKRTGAIKALQRRALAALKRALEESGVTS